MSKHRCPRKHAGEITRSLAGTTPAQKKMPPPPHHPVSWASTSCCWQALSPGFDGTTRDGGGRLRNFDVTLITLGKIQK